MLYRYTFPCYQCVYTWSHLWGLGSSAKPNWSWVPKWFDAVKKQRISAVVVAIYWPAKSTLISKCSFVEHWQLHAKLLMTWGGNISRAYFKSPVWYPWANVDLNPGAVLQLNFDFVPFIRTIAPLYNLCWKQSELFWRWNDFIVRLSVTQMAFLNVKFFLWFFQFHIYFIRSLFMLKRHC